MIHLFIKVKVHFQVGKKKVGTILNLISNFSVIYALDRSEETEFI